MAEYNSEGIVPSSRVKYGCAVSRLLVDTRGIGQWGQMTETLLQVVTRVNATDADMGYAGLVRYTTWDELFEVDYVSGEVRVAGDLSKLLKPGSPFFYG